uniref:Uncharacterized protein n=1 Tax=Anguilla anguilla TaxID=7936 RepID=A0A0E9W441_ANGAN
MLLFPVMKVPTYPIPPLLLFLELRPTKHALIQLNKLYRILEGKKLFFSPNATWGNKDLSGELLVKCIFFAFLLL